MLQMGQKVKSKKKNEIGVREVVMKKSGGRERAERENGGGRGEKKGGTEGGVERGREKERERIGRGREEKEIGHVWSEAMRQWMPVINCQQPTESQKGKALRGSMVLTPW